MACIASEFSPLTIARNLRNNHIRSSLVMGRWSMPKCIFVVLVALLGLVHSTSVVSLPLSSSGSEMHTQHESRHAPFRSLKVLEELALRAKLSNHCTIYGNAETITRLVQPDFTFHAQPQASSLKETSQLLTKAVAVKVTTNSSSAGLHASTQDLKHDPFIASEWVSSSFKSFGGSLMESFHSNLPRKPLHGGATLKQWPEPWPATAGDIWTNPYVESLGTLWFIPLLFACVIFLMWLLWFLFRAIRNACGKRWATELYRETRTHCYIFGFAVLGIACGVACAFAWTGHTRFVHALDDSIKQSDIAMDHFSDFSPIMTQVFGQTAPSALNAMKSLAILAETGFNTHLGDVNEILTCLSSTVSPLQQSEATSAPLADVARAPAAAQTLATQLGALPSLRTEAAPGVSQAATAARNLAAALVDATAPHPTTPTDDTTRVALLASADFETTFAGWISAHTSVRTAALSANPSFAADLEELTPIADAMEALVLPLQTLVTKLSGMHNLDELADTLQLPPGSQPFEELRDNFSTLSQIVASLPSLQQLRSDLRDTLGGAPPYSSSLSAKSASIMSRVQGSTIKGAAASLLSDPDTAAFYEKILKLSAVLNAAKDLYDIIKSDGELSTSLKPLVSAARTTALASARLNKGLSSLADLVVQDGPTLVSQLDAATNALAGLTCYPSVYTRLQGIQNTLADVKGLTKNVVQNGAFLSQIVQNPAPILAASSNAQAALSNIDSDLSSSGLQTTDIQSVQQRMSDLRLPLSSLLSPTQDENIEDRDVLSLANDAATVTLPSADAVAEDSTLLSVYHRIFDFDAAGVDLANTPSTTATMAELIQAASNEAASLSTILRALNSAISSDAAPILSQITERVVALGTISTQADAVAAADAQLAAALADIETQYPTGLETTVFDQIDLLDTKVQACAPHISTAVEYLSSMSDVVYSAVGLPAALRSALISCLGDLDTHISSLPDLSLLHTHMTTIATTGAQVATLAKPIWTALTDDLPATDAGPVLSAEINNVLPFIAGSTAEPKLYQRIIALAPPSTAPPTQALDLFGVQLDGTTSPLPLEPGATYPGAGALVDEAALTNFASTAIASAEPDLINYTNLVKSGGLVLAQPDHTPAVGPPTEPSTAARGAPAVDVIQQELLSLETLRNEIPWDTLDRVIDFDETIASGLEFRDSLNSIYASYQNYRNDFATDFERWNGIRLLAANMFVFFPLLLATAAVWAGWKRKHGCALFVSLLWFTTAIVLFLLTAVELSLAVVLSDQCVDLFNSLTYHLSYYSFSSSTMGQALNQPELDITDLLLYFVYGSNALYPPPPFLDALAQPEGIFDRLGINAREVAESLGTVSGITLAAPMQTLLNQLVTHQSTAESLSLALRTKLDFTAMAPLYEDFNHAFCHKGAASLAVSALMVLLLSIFSTCGAVCAARAYKRFNRRWIVDDGLVLNPYMSEVLGVAPFSLDDPKALAKYAEKRANAQKRREVMRTQLGQSASKDNDGQGRGRAAMFGKSSAHVHPEMDDEVALSLAAWKESAKANEHPAQPVPAAQVLPSGSPNERNFQKLNSRTTDRHTSTSTREREKKDTSSGNSPVEGLPPVNIHVSQEAKTQAQASPVASSAASSTPVMYSISSRAGAPPVAPIFRAYPSQPQPTPGLVSQMLSESDTSAATQNPPSRPQPQLQGSPNSLSATGQFEQYRQMRLRQPQPSSAAPPVPPGPNRLPPL